MNEYTQTGDIAIIGMSGRFPGASNLEEFWHNLKNGVESISIFNDEQILGSGVDPSVLRHPNYVKAGSILKDIDLFDASFFGFSPKEAEITDPQHRIFMECAWEALENAGYNPQKSQCSIGVFAGTSISNYLLFNLWPTLDLTQTTNYLQNLIGNDKDYLATHTSYKLNLKGLSVGIQTACSTSLVSLIIACDSLLSYQCDLALAGGITVRVPQESGYIYEEGSILSPDGHCRSFDAQAGGTIFGSGAGVVVLKRLADAIADRDCIHAVIKGTAINNDGAMKVGYTAPSVDGQSEVIAMAHAMAGVDAETISYVEAHGTGTYLGDPIEIAALTQVFRATTQKNGFCAIGSVKTNVGHLEAASGVAGLIKTVLALKHRLLPPSLHFEQPNPQIDFPQSPFYVNTKLSEWKTDGKPRYVGVSSFGMGGTNAHLILSEAPALTPVVNQVERSLHLLSLSAKSQKALQELASRYENFLASHPEASHPDICFTANTGRGDFDYRLAVVSQSIAQLREQLGSFLAGVETSRLVSGQVNQTESLKIAFLFTGQGSQYIAMGGQLYQESPIFRQTLDLCHDILRPYLDKPLLSILYPEADQTSPIDETAYTQPALFALEYSLYELWKSWGIQPDLVMGHSVGEYVAATVAGVFSLEDGLKLIAERGRLMQALPENGHMVVVFASEDKVREAIQSVADQMPALPPVAIAAINSPNNTVISGDHKALEAVCTVLVAEGIKTKKLKVSHAFHSPLMEPILADFNKVATSITYSTPKIPLSSNITGKLIGNEIATPEYWCRHIRQPVRFAEGMKTLHEQGCQVFVEIGPNPTSLAMGHQCLHEVGVFLPSLRQGHSDWQELLQSLAALYVRGVQVDWFGFDQNYLRSRLELPTYPFQRQRYWVDRPGISITAKSRLAVNQVCNQVIHPLLGQRLQSPLLKDNQLQFESKISDKFPAFLEQHRIYDQAIFPASAYLEMALVAGSEVFPSDKLVVEKFVIYQALILLPNQEKILQLILTSSESLEYSFHIFSFNPAARQSADSWILHASGNLLQSKQNSEIPHINLEQLTQCNEEISPQDYYQKFGDRGIDYGASFQGIERLCRHKGEALGQIRLPELLRLEAGNYKLHPSLLDACFQVLGAGIDDSQQGNSYVLVGIERLAVLSYPDSSLWSYAQIHPVNEPNQQTLSADLQLISLDGQVIISLQGLLLKQVSGETLLGKTSPGLLNSLYEVEWRASAHIPQVSPTTNLLAPSVIGDHILPQVNELISQHDIKIYSELLAKLETLSITYVLKSFQNLGWKFTLNQRFSTTEMAQQLGIANQHQRLLHRLLEMLVEEGILQQLEKEVWEVASMPQIADPQEQVSALFSEYPSKYSTEITLLECCGSKLAEVLRQECDALDLLFPQGDLTLVSKLYQDSPWARVMNTLVQKSVLSALEPLYSQKTVRVLEIGAGTGGTTSYLLPLLPHQIKYVFTDVSPLFVAKAQEKFRDYAFVKYQVLDIEQPPEDQGFTLHQYDLIVAANVVHATKDLRSTLQHLQQLLVAGGILVLLEGTVSQRWVDLTFGLTDGWWRFTDVDLRPDYPLLSVVQWQKLLQENGFQEAITIPQTQDSQSVLSQQAVLIAKYTNTQPEAIKNEPRNWLILADNLGIGQQLATLFRAKNQTCTLVFAGKNYEQLAEQEFRIDPTSLADFQRLFNEKVVTGLQGIVHLWSLEAPEPPDLSVGDLEAASQKASGSTLYLIQTLVKAGLKQPPSLWLVTQGAISVGVKSTVSGVTQSPLWGIGKIIALEHPEFNCVQVDLDPNTPDDNAQTLFAEICSKSSEDQVAFSKNSRLVARLVSKQFPAPVVQNQLKCRSDSTYLITGGLGFLGLLVTRWLVECGAKHLVIVGRSAASPAANSQLRELEQMGTQVVVRLADVSQTEQIAAVLEEIKQSLPPLRGIIHAAGVLDDSTLLQLSWEQFSRVMASKVAGAWNLHNLTLDTPLDFFVLFSSISSVIGISGQANYAAANAFLDALAHYRRHRGLTGLSINWGVWSLTESTLAREQGESFLSMKGMEFIGLQEGLQVLNDLLMQSAIQVTVLPVKWSKFLQQFPPGGSPPLFSEFVDQLQQQVENGQLEIQPIKLMHRLKEVSAESRLEILVAYLQEQAAKVLGISSSEPINANQLLNELGFDSLMSINLKNQIRNELGIELPMQKFVESSSIVKLALALIEQLSLTSLIQTEQPPTELNDDLEEIIL